MGEYLNYHLDTAKTKGYYVYNLVVCVCMYKLVV